MDSLTDLFKGIGPGGTPPILPGTGGGGGGIPDLSGGGGTTGGRNWISKVLPYALLGSGIFGTVGNIQANRARNAVLSAEMRQMGNLEKLTPAQITQGILSMKQPLSQGLTQSVGNVVQANMAERGLSQAPGIFSTALAQGLAPYDLQLLNAAQDAYFKKLGLPISARPSPFGPFPTQTNTAPIWQLLTQRFMGHNPANPYATVPGLTVPSDINQTGPSQDPLNPFLNTALPFLAPGLTDLPQLTGGSTAGSQGGL